ncbi:MAG: DoxX family membrane protein [Deltaproteobacteria bacterium]|jgi:hypothetical protein|nr:DoxX family membrane protein [Deltaproteobacteria bacterium]
MKHTERIAYHLMRIVLAATFLYAGFVKTSDVLGFARQIAGYQLLPYAVNVLVAATLPYVECLAGVLLLFNLRVRSALLVIGGLLLVFMAALVSVLIRGLEIDCGCFNPGDGQGVSAAEALWRDVALMAVVVGTWWLRSREFSRAR